LSKSNRVVHYPVGNNHLHLAFCRNGSQDPRRPRSLHGPSLLPVQDHARHQQLLLPLRPPPVLLLRLNSITSTLFEHIHWADPSEGHTSIPSA
ncbi:hypothetical protein B0H65DRAFT_427986, partial [Neurospora tetraspora]